MRSPPCFVIIFCDIIEKMRVKKRESLKRRLFYLAASFLSEAIDEIVDIVIDPYDISGYQKLQRQRAANVAYQLKKTGYIEKVIDKNGEVYFRFTDKGKTRLIREIPLLRFQTKPWDGKWRQVVFDIPEEMRAKREKLRDKLLSLGFGMLQRSVYITPFDISEQVADFLEEHNLSEYAVVFEMERLSGESEKELANVVWKLDDLHRRYLDFVMKWERLLEATNEEILKKFEAFQGEYFSILLADPGLPRELLPDDWLSSQANKIYKGLLSRYHWIKRKKIKKGRPKKRKPA